MGSPEQPDRIEGDNLMPYFAATYASNVNKIFATMGPYVVKCNATTGVRESVTKLTQGQPTYGPLSIVYHPGVGKLFVGGCGNCPNKQEQFAPTIDPPVFRDIYQVDPTTMSVTSTGIMPQINAGAFPNDGLRSGPYFLMADGNYVYFLYMSNIQGEEWGRIHAGTYAYNGGDGFRWRAEQMSVGASYGDYVYRLDPNQLEIEYLDKAGVPPVGGYLGQTSIAPYTPVGIVRSTVEDKNWIVCGDTNLLRQESLTNNDVTVFDLGAVIGPTELPDPCRIRDIGGLLYMPCMTANGIIIHTPGSAINTAVWKGGFDGPMDVVSTGTKVFAVQNSPVGLKEIT